MTANRSTIEDILEDPQLKMWVLEGDTGAGAYWSQWLQANPARENDLLLAKELLLFMDTLADPVAQAETWQRIAGNTDQTSTSSGIPPTTKIKKLPGRPSNWPRWVAAAAILAAVVWFSGILERKESWLTAATVDELRTVILPDSSVVRMNIHSNIRYAKRWNATSPRDVWVEGEAYFSVKHKTNNQPFIVHTNDVEINVVGTEFNVNTRRIKTEVELCKGAVKLALKADDRAPILMKPGDKISYSKRTKILKSKKVDPVEIASWRSHVLSFTDATIEEVVAAIKDNMNIEIKIDDPDLLHQTYTGSIPMDDVQIFFTTLNRTFNVQVKQTGQHQYKIVR